MDQSERWWVRRCLTRQARKTSRQAVRWPIIPTQLPNEPGEFLGLLWTLPTTEQCTKYTVLFTDGFSRHASMHALPEPGFTAEGSADMLVNQ